jgi:hypothetical protein
MTWTSDDNGGDDLNLDFATDAVEPQKAFEPLPPGRYRVGVRKVSIKPTKAGNGKRLNVELVVVDGDCKGRVVFHGLNIQHATPQAQEIGRRELAGLLLAAGMPGARDMAQLVGVEVVATLKVRPARDGYDASNEVRGYEPCSGSTQTSTPPASAAPGAAPKKPPRFIG